MYMTYVPCVDFFGAYVTFIPHFFWIQNPEYPLENHSSRVSGQVLLMEMTLLLVGEICDQAKPTRVLPSLTTGLVQGWDGS